MGLVQTKRVIRTHNRCTKLRIGCATRGVIGCVAASLPRRQRAVAEGHGQQDSDLCAVELCPAYQAVSAVEPHPRRCPLCLHKWREYFWYLCHHSSGRGRGESFDHVAPKNVRDVPTSSVTTSPRIYDSEARRYGADIADSFCGRVFVVPCQVDGASGLKPPFGREIMPSEVSSGMQ